MKVAGAHLLLNRRGESCLVVLPDVASHAPWSRRLCWNGVTTFGQRSTSYCQTDTGSLISQDMALSSAHMVGSDVWSSGQVWSPGRMRRVSEKLRSIAVVRPSCLEAACHFMVILHARLRAIASLRHRYLAINVSHLATVAPRGGSRWCPMCSSWLIKRNRSCGGHPLGGREQRRLSPEPGRDVLHFGVLENTPAW